MCALLVLHLTSYFNYSNIPIAPKVLVVIDWSKFCSLELGCARRPRQKRVLTQIPKLDEKKVIIPGCWSQVNLAWVRALNPGVFT